MMTIGSLFDGSGGFPLAATMCGITPAWASEVEPYPIAVTRSRFPQMKHLGSVTEVKGGEVEPVDIITFGSPCFPAGTLVLTDSGYTPIEELKCGDLVFTHKGNWKPVSAIGSKYSPTLKLKGNHYGLVTTPNHPFYSAVQGKVRNGNGYDRTLTEVGEWTPAKNMQGKRWAVPNNISGLTIPRIEKQSSRQNDPPEVNADLMYIIGRWLGDGWLRDGQKPGRSEGNTFGQIFICANSEKAPYLEKRMRRVFEGVSAVYKTRERTMEKFRISNQALCRWLKRNFGSYAYGKKIPAWAYCMSLEMREALLQGYLDSDGYRFKENIWKATTVSKELAHGIRLLAETLGYSCAVHYAEVGNKTTIEGRTVNQRPQYQVVMNKGTRTTALRHGSHTWYKCKKVEPYSSKQMVYNITVDDDHSYIVEGFVVHNCQDLSIAGNRAGLKHETNGDGETTRSGLFVEAVRIIKEMREETDGRYPTFAVWENVPGAFSSNGGEDFRTVLEELIKIVEPSAAVPAVPAAGWPYADLYCGDGWSLAYRTLDAQYWGVPQRRRRIYLVLDLRGQRAGEVLFERPGLRGYFAEGRPPWKGSTGETEGCAGAADHPCLLKIRSGCEGGGKGPLVQVNKSATLSCNNDQYLFQAVSTPILDDQGRPWCYDARGNGNGSTVSTLTGDHENRITDYTSVVCMAHGQAHAEILKDKSPFMAGVDSRGALTPWDNQARRVYAAGGTFPALAAREKAGQNQQAVLTQYIVRRLTPTECARLQGFPDHWGHPDRKEELTDEEYAFWTTVRTTFEAINGRVPKTYRREQMLAWYNKLHTDSAEYKMWGNGIALPTALYVMQGISDAMKV